VKKHQDNLLDVQAIILANLCVCYVMNTDNEKAEELLRSIEREEEEESTRDPEKRLFHLCIVNLVIGTLYCSKVHLREILSMQQLFSFLVSHRITTILGYVVS